MTGTPITPYQPAVAMTTAEIAALNTSGLIPGFTILEQETGKLQLWTGKIFVTVSYAVDLKISTLNKLVKLGFPLRTKNPLRTAISGLAAPVSGASSSMSAAQPHYLLGYASMAELVSLGGVNLNTTALGATFGFNNVTNDLVPNYGGISPRISFYHTGRYFEIQFQGGTTSVFFVKVDGLFESLTAVTETNAYRKYDLGSSATRRIDIIAGGTNTSSFYPQGIRVDATDSIFPAPLYGPRTIFLSDSFGAAPCRFPNAFAEAMGWDDVWAAGVGSTGYIANGPNNDGTLPTFGARVKHDVIDFNPQVVGVVGSVNDESQTYTALYNAALSLYNTLKLSLPNALIFSVPTARGGVDGMSTALLAKKKALKDAAAESGILWVDIIENTPTYAPYSTTVKFNAGATSTTIVLNIAWGSDNHCYGLEGSTISLKADQERHLVKSTTNNSGFTQCTLVKALANSYVAGDAVDIVGGSYLTGYGKVGSTTGYGNSDLLISANDHPQTPAGDDALGLAIANGLLKAVKLS